MTNEQVNTQKRLLSERLADAAEMSVVMHPVLHSLGDGLRECASDAAELERDKTALALELAEVMQKVKAAIEEKQAAERENGAKQARIDALMLEFSPGEMPNAQLEEWGRNQRASHEPKGNGWITRAHEDSKAWWLTLKAPDGSAVAFSCPKESIRAIVLKRFAEQISSEPKPAEAIDCQECIKLITERDEVEAMCDALTAGIAGMLGIEDFGEHSSSNYPWDNANEAAKDFIAGMHKQQTAKAKPLHLREPPHCPT